MSNFTTTIEVPQSPAQVFEAIADVGAWWGGGEVTGRTAALGDRFHYRYGDRFHVEHEITAWESGRRIVWHVTDSATSFPDPHEWTGTNIVFELAAIPNGTALRFTHEGLVPTCTCYAACRDGWTYHLHEGLRRRIANDFTRTFAVDQPPARVFAAINDVRGWWSEDLEGETDRLGAVFTFRHGALHRSVHEIRELVPDERVVWHVLDGELAFVTDRAEWIGTDIVFAIHRRGERTEVRFTHVGLAPTIECYGACTRAWSFYLGSLKRLIETGTGEPERR